MSQNILRAQIGNVPVLSQTNPFSQLGRGSKVGKWNPVIRQSVKLQDSSGGTRKRKLSRWDVMEKSPVCAKKLHPSQAFEVGLEAAWRRGMEKYSPCKYAQHSPVKPLEANLEPVFVRSSFNDSDLSLVVGFSWTLSMTEQFFYDNSLTLLSKYRANSFQMQQVLRLNSADIKQQRQRIQHDFVELHLLGKGAFGKVFRALDIRSQQFVAIKIVKPPKITKQRRFFKYLLEFITERNYLIKARNSPFVVHFYFSFVEPVLNSMILVFECCKSDLSRVLAYWQRFLTYSIVADIAIGSNDRLSKVYTNIGKCTKIVDLDRVVLIYILELFCGLDFLVQCNILHSDIKPDNVMVAANGHLKIADFGLVRHLHFITVPQQVDVVRYSDLDQLTSSRYENKDIQGTKSYYDMELQYKVINQKQRNAVDSKIQVASFNEKSYSACFMTDVWAMALIALQVLLMGERILDKDLLPAHAYKRYGFFKNCSTSVFILGMTLWKRPYSELLQKRLVEFAGPQLRELVTFLVSLLRPRANRGQGFTAEKEVLILDKRLNMTHLDLAKIASIDVFRNSGVTPANVFLLPLPTQIGDPEVSDDDVSSSRDTSDSSQSSEKKHVFKDYSNMMDYFDTKIGEKSMFPVDPAINFSLL